MIRAAAAFTILLAAGVARPPLAGDEERAQRERAFDEGCARVHALADARRYGEAYDAYQALLVEHAREPYAAGRALEIEADLLRLAFRRQHDEPALDDLLAADVQRWDRERGDVRLAVRPDALDDFEPHAGERGTIHELHLAWSGPFTATFTGRARDLAETEIQLLAPDGGCYAVVVGGPARAHEMLRRRDADGEVARVASAPCAAADPDARVQARVAVSQRAIELAYGGASVLRVERDDPPALGIGTFAFLTVGGFDELVLAGRADPGFFQERIDAADEAARVAFERAWRREDHLPPWLVEAAREVLDAAPERSAFPMPGAFDLATTLESDPGAHPETTQHLATVSGLVEAGALEDALAHLQGLAQGAMDPTWRAFLTCTTLWLLGRPSEALEAGEPLWTEQPGSLAAGCLRGALLADLKREPEAIDVYRRLTEAHPASFEAWHGLASALLRVGRGDEALDALERGEVAADQPAALYALERRIALTRSGPPWARTSETRALHFVVRSGVDAHTTRLIAREAESAWRDLERMLGKPSAAPARSIPVLVFPGASSYRAFTAGVLASDVEHSAGLFDRNLQAIVVQSQPARDDVLRTVRHEVLHQYLDARLGGAPVWLHEGLAEYHEIVVHDRGLPRAGDVHPIHRVTLARGGLIDLRTFVHLAPTRFYADGVEAYAQAWALVHYLQHGGIEPQERFRDLWARLARREDDRTAVDGAFAGVDWDAWDRDFEAYVARRIADR